MVTGPTWLVAYDIPDDRVRTKVSELCLDKGLARVQYSCFLGQMSDAMARELMLQCRRAVGKNPAHVILIPICAKDLKKMLTVRVA